MDRHARLEALPRDLRLVATIGAFDGVHRGHEALLRSLVREARRRGAAAVVVTFEPHPATVLRGLAPELIGDPAERDERLANLSVDHLVVEHFDAALAAQTAETFVGRLGSDRALVALLMTRRSVFGHARGGTFETMTALGARQGFAVVEVPELTLGGQPVSSSRVREAVMAGRLAEAARLLGRRYAVTGTVQRGDGRGRLLGFPTANLAFDAPVALPPDGIYAVLATWRSATDAAESTADGVASLGVRPTFGGGSRVLEVHLLDRDEPLYGARLRVAFVRRQRAERRYASAAALVAQMERDAIRARAILAGSTDDTGAKLAGPSTR